MTKTTRRIFRATRRIFHVACHWHEKEDEFLFALHSFLRIFALEKDFSTKEKQDGNTRQLQNQPRPQYR